MFSMLIRNLTSFSSKGHLNSKGKTSISLIVVDVRICNKLQESDEFIMMKLVKQVMDDLQPILKPFHFSQSSGQHHHRQVQIWLIMQTVCLNFLMPENQRILCLLALTDNTFANFETNNL